MANFSSCEKVQQVIMAGDTVQARNGANRSKILNAANCMPPVSPELAKKMGLKVNVNFGELSVLLKGAVTQMLSAFTANEYYFEVELPAAPKETQSEWGSSITENINRIMKQNIQYYMLHRSRWSSVAKYGIGAMTWRHDDKWRPKFCALADLRIPTDTTLDFDNLNWYAQRIPYTVSELLTEVFNNNPNNHWDKKAVAQILKGYKELNTTDATNNINWETDFEKLASIAKQDGGFYGSNALPTIPLYHFYFENEGQWYMRVVPETGNVKGADTKFLWQSEDSVGKSWKELIHCQFGDLSFDDPPTFGGVRGLGLLLMEPTFYGNLTRCRYLQHVMDSFNILLRIDDPAEKARAAIQEFNNLAVLRKGVGIVPNTERHQVDPNNVELILSQMKQLQGEASSSYTQQADTGTQKEQTAFETRVKAEQVNTMTSGIILNASEFEDQANLEICRRFCLPNSKDPEIVLFRQRMTKAGVPAEWLDVKQWSIKTVTPIGMGNPTIAQATVKQLQEIAPKLNATAQNEINHDTVLVYTKNARKARRWAPIGVKPGQSDAKKEAMGLFATLLIAAPGSVPPPEDNYIDQIDVLLPLLAGKVMLYTQRDNMATPDEAMGLNNVLTYVNQAVAALAQDVQQAGRVKKYKDDLAKVGNEVKALTQRGQAAIQAAQKKQNDAQQAESAAKIHLEQVETAHRMALKATEAREDNRRKDSAARSEQRRKDAVAHASIQRDEFKALAGAHNARLKSVQTSDES